MKKYQLGNACQNDTGADYGSAIDFITDNAVVQLTECITDDVDGRKDTHFTLGRNAVFCHLWGCDAENVLGNIY